MMHHGLDRQAFDIIYDELTPNIPLNQIFRFAVERLHQTSQDPENRRLLGELNEWFYPVTQLSQVTQELLDSIQFNRLNERFQLAYTLARLFLSSHVIQMTSGDQPVYAF